MLQQAHATGGGAAGGADIDAAELAVGGAAGNAAGGAAGGAEEPKTLRQQACATDDGEFEKMMAKLDAIDRQEAAADGRALSAGLLLTVWSHRMADLLLEPLTTCNICLMLTSSDWTHSSNCL